MGLDTTHNAWHGAYSAFNRWRTEIARHLGIPLELMEGFYPTEGNQYHSPLSLVEYAVRESKDDLTKSQFERHKKHFPLLWDAFKPCALHELLYHSDCDGEIEWEKCGPIADELSELLAELPDEDFGGHIGNIREKTKLFIDGLRLAHQQKENLEFH